MKRSLSLIFAMAALCAMAAPVSARGGDRTLRVKMYQSSSVAKSTCRLIGRELGKPRQTTIKVLTHTVRNGSRVFTTTIPTKFVIVDVMCRANGPYKSLRLDLRQQSLRNQWVKASCPSSQPDSKCTVHAHSGDPD